MRYVQLPRCGPLYTLKVVPPVPYKKLVGIIGRSARGSRHQVQSCNYAVGTAIDLRAHMRRLALASEYLCTIFRAILAPSDCCHDCSLRNSSSVVREKHLHKTRQKRSPPFLYAPSSSCLQRSGMLYSSHKFAPNMLRINLNGSSSNRSPTQLLP